MNDKPVYKCAVVSVVKHAYVPLGMQSHPRFELTVVTDQADSPDWIHQRNQKFADEQGIPYVPDVAKAIDEFDLDVAVVSSEAERHCDLSVLSAEAGLHVVQDKPMSTRLSECERVVEAVQRNDVRFMMWNRNCLPALIHTRRLLEEGAIGELTSIHVDFYFAKDAGPPKGARPEGDPPINWLERQIEAHADGSDGGVGVEPMGELAIEGIYPLAYIQMLARSAVQRVYAQTTAHFHQASVDNDIDDLATVTLEMDNGILGSLCIGRIGAASHPDIGEIKLHLLGTEGGLVVSEARPEVSVYYRGQPAKEFRSLRIGNDNDYLLADDFAQAIDEGRETLLDAHASRDIFKTVQAAIDSGKSGVVVAIT